MADKTHHCMQHAIHSVFVFSFTGPIAKLIKQWKYQDQWRFRELLCYWLLQRINIHLNAHVAPKALLAVPLATKRLKQRGFNQSALLANYLSKQLNIPFLPNAVIRKQSTQAQFSLDIDQRHNNLKNAFILNPNITLPNHIAIVDDVLTTGATLESIAQTIIKQHDCRIEYWGLARTVLKAL